MIFDHGDSDNLDYSDNSSLWNKAKEEFFGKTEGSKNDGIFYMEFSAYISYFQTISICHVLFDAILHSYYFNSEQATKPHAFKLTVNDDNS